jgi:hypothetical protein
MSIRNFYKIKQARGLGFVIKEISRHQAKKTKVRNSWSKYSSCCERDPHCTERRKTDHKDM